MFIVPYMVVAAVAILFFIVCRFIVYGVGGKSRHAGVKAEVTAEIPVRPRISFEEKISWCRKIRR